MDTELMLHDRAMSGGSLAAGRDRRSADRLPFPAELSMVWHHDLQTTVRYQIQDVSDGGFRITTHTPLIAGMTGTVLRLLPEGQPIDRSVMVAWVGPPDEDGAYEIGLRAFRAM